jgi:hypothetical protein
MWTTSMPRDPGRAAPEAAHSKAADFPAAVARSGNRWESWSAPKVRGLGSAFQLLFVISRENTKLSLHQEWPIPAATCGPIVGPQLPATGPTRPGLF